MKSRWLSAAFLAVALATSACGGTEEALQLTQSSNSLGGTCQEDCAMQCGELYPDNSTLRERCTTSCIIDACGGADYP
jgi:hypothetical protein